MVPTYLGDLSPPDHLCFLAELLPSMLLDLFNVILHPCYLLAPLGLGGDPAATTVPSKDFLCKRIKG